MIEFELDRESVVRAEKLSSLLSHDLRIVAEEGAPSEMRREFFSELRYPDLAEGVPINDVVADVDQMATEFAFARRWDAPILCFGLDEGDLAPISMNEFFGGTFWSPFFSEDWPEFWEPLLGFRFPSRRFWEAIRARFKREEADVRVVGFLDAIGAVERGLMDFLSYRFSGIKKWHEWILPRSGGMGSGSPPTPPAVGPGGGLQVQVSCLTPGLRIHVAPAYFISWVFFGSPTTPVTSWVRPGRYVFAGDGPMLPKRTKDPGVFCIPPSFYPSLTRF